MNPQGWTVMLVSVSLVLALAGYCLYRVLRLPPVEMKDIKGPLEINTGDIADKD